jgi:hypothetical protein
MAITIGRRTGGMDGCWSSWSEQEQPMVIRTQMEDGTIKVRRRNTGKHRVATVTRTFKAEHYVNFQLWFDVACAQGIYATRMMTPYGTEEVWRFSSAPQIQWADSKAFSVSCEIEQLAGWEKL